MAEHVLIYDCDKKAPACVIIQALYGCDGSLLYEFGFDSSTWLTYPTAGMKKIRGTREQWEKAAMISNNAINQS